MPDRMGRCAILLRFCPPVYLMATAKKKPAPAKTRARSPAPENWTPALRECFPPGTYLQAPNLLTREEMKEHLAGQDWNHYVYGLSTDFGLMFYIGKGTGMRALAHELEADKRESRKNAAIKACGARLRYSIIACCADDNYAAGIEAMHLFQNKDVLTNIAGCSIAAFERMDTVPDPMSQVFGHLQQVQDLIRIMTEQTDAAARQLVAAFPQFRDELFPEPCGACA